MGRETESKKALESRVQGAKLPFFVCILTSVFCFLFLIGCGGGGDSTPATTTTTTTSTTTTTTTTTTTAGTLPGKYLLAFHSCDTAATSCGTPNNHYTYLGYSDDGASWSPVSGFTTYQGSVPDIIKRGDTLYFYNPQKVRKYTVSTQTLGGSVDVSMKTSDGMTESYVDPSPYLDTATNKIILFYLSSTGVSGDPAQCTTCPMRSATEVDGSDGTQFVVDSGDRILMSNGTDPDIFYDGSKYILYISLGARVYVATSATLQGTYALVSTLSGGLLTTAGGVPAGHYDSATGKYWTYVHDTSNPSVIKRAVHSDFSTSLSSSDFTTVVSGSSFSGLGATYIAQSPGFLVNN